MPKKGVCILVALVLWISLFGTPGRPGPQDAEPGKRYGVAVDLQTFAQGTPRETLASVLKAIDEKKFDYLLAQLTDPAFVDERVETTGGNFETLVREAAAKVKADPRSVKLLRRFLNEGEWTTTETTAVVKLKDVPDRSVYFRRMGNRWYMENRYK